MTLAPVLSKRWRHPGTMVPLLLGGGVLFPLLLRAWWFLCQRIGVCRGIRPAVDGEATAEGGLQELAGLGPPLPPPPPTEKVPAAAESARAGEVLQPRVAWVSLNPVHGVLDAYSGDLAARIEAALQQHEPSMDLGVFGATVHFDAHGPGRHIQSTSGGRRDVCRLALQEGATEATVAVCRPGRAWRIVHGDGGGTSPYGRRAADFEREERTVLLSREVLVDPAALEVAGSGECSPDAPPVCAANTSASAAAEDPGSLPLWQWCRKEAQAASWSHTLPPHDWGVYSCEQNAAIEAAFQAGEADLEVSVGIRAYRVVFGPESGFARQVDEALHRRRLVRRILTTPEQRASALNPAAPEVARGQESCPICCVDFGESAAMPVLELPACRHAFHMACAQQLADSSSSCPCCRVEVDWAGLGFPPRWRR